MNSSDDNSKPQKIAKISDSSEISISPIDIITDDALFEIFKFVGMFS